MAGNISLNRQPYLKSVYCFFSYNSQNFFLDHIMLVWACHGHHYQFENILFLSHKNFSSISTKDPCDEVQIDFGILALPISKQEAQRCQTLTSVVLNCYQVVALYFVCCLCSTLCYSWA